MTTKKGKSSKRFFHSVWTEDGWRVITGELKRGGGRPSKTKSIFEIVAEKIPYGALSAVRKDMIAYGYPTSGVYFAHDSFGVARYGGRGNIFVRLAEHKRKRPRELQYFSFYTIAAKNHEREIETAILRAAGPQMLLNTRKVAQGIEAGNVQDYEPGTQFFERQVKRGRKR